MKKPRNFYKSHIDPTRYGPIYKNRAIARMQMENKSGAREDFEAYACVPYLMHQI